MAAEFRKGFVKSGDSPDVFRSRGLSSREGVVRLLHHVVARPWAHRVTMWCGPPFAPLRLVLLLRESPVAAPPPLRSKSSAAASTLPRHRVRPHPPTNTLPLHFGRAALFRWPRACLASPGPLCRRRWPCSGSAARSWALPFSSAPGGRWPPSSSAPFMGAASVAPARLLLASPPCLCARGGASVLQRVAPSCPGSGRSPAGVRLRTLLFGSERKLCDDGACGRGSPS